MAPPSGSAIWTLSRLFQFLPLILNNAQHAFQSLHFGLPPRKASLDQRRSCKLLPILVTISNRTIQTLFVFNFGFFTLNTRYTMNDVASHALTFLLGTATGAAGKYFADKYTDRRRQQETAAATKSEFAKLFDLMPDLLGEMQIDLSE